MNLATKYLPAFDAYHIETYFLNDAKVIAEMFMLSYTTINEDLDAVQSAFEARDLYLMREAVHKIKPMFNIVGLLALERDVRQFYNLCLEATSFEELQDEYKELLPKLIDARSLINEQALLFHCEMEKV